MFLPLVLAIGYGLFDEIHQSFVPTRTFQVVDLVLNSAGAILGLLAVVYLQKKAPPIINRLAEKLAIL